MPWSILFSALLFLLLACDNSRQTLQKSEEYWELLKKNERDIIEKIPIWEDYTRPEIEKELRKFLLPYHLLQARTTKPITSDTEIETLKQQNHLISLEVDQAGWFFYNVPTKYRYAHPQVLQILHIVEEAISLRLQELGIAARIKFAISSAVRPVQYQQILRNTNENAAIISSHSYGLSVDIFYDEFFVSVPPPEADNETRQYLAKLRTRVGYLLGASLRRQLRTILTEALLELQREGKLYVIWEKNQRCYHITPVIL